MTRVTGIGGIFFKAKESEKLCAWYARHLVLAVEPWGGVQFRWRRDEAPQRLGYTVWSIFQADTRYFEPSEKPFMINYRVENPDRVLAELKSEGVPVDEKIEESEYGRFGWAMDPEGNRIELWEPPAEDEKTESRRG
jgi:catechol 2,3-dioxygenase-like lactoylglutathione lyase family enzyme